MNPKPEDQEKPDENGAPTEVDERIGCIASLIPVTTPGCASLLTAVFLITTVISVWVYFWLDPANVPWRHAYSWFRILTILGLIAVIPWIVHRTVKVWLEGVHPTFPEVDAAWRAGLNALAANDIAIDSVPIFVIVGSSGEAQEKSIMSASGTSYSVDGVPQGPAPLHWYANSEAIYLFCTDSSWTSALASLREEMASEWNGLSPQAEYVPTPFATPSPPSYQEPKVRGETNSTFVTTSPTPSTPNPTPSKPTSSIRGTLELNDFVDSTRPAANPPQSNPPTPPASTYRGTLMFDDQNSSGATPAVPPRSTSHSLSASSNLPPTSSPISSPAPSPSSNSISNNPSPHKPVLLSHQYSSSCIQELYYLGDLLRRIRRPVCPTNGILTLLQFESIHSSTIELDELKKALRSDVQTLMASTGLRSPVTTLVVGLEKERGFRELVRRVGKERAIAQRFGRRFDVQSIPTKNELASLAVLACSVFEDWAYSLFREEQSLTKPGNTRLYELLSKVRCSWKSKLSEILSDSFAVEAGRLGSSSPLLYSGCYFAATGESADRQAFVKGIMEKLIEEQELVEWSDATLYRHKSQQWNATIGMVLTAILLVLLIVQLVLSYFV